MGDNAYQIPEAGADDDFELDGEIIKEWKASTAYVEGDKVIYNGKVWQAAWWTQGDTPGVAADNGSEPWKYVQDVNTGEETTTPSSEPETTTKDSETVAAVNLEINGCQISTTLEGYRVVYSIDDSKNEVENAGLVYGVSASDSDIVVGSTNGNVVSYQATDAGKTDINYSQYTNAQSYVMTMTFIKNAAFFNSPIKVRAYAKLNDGRYVYSDIKEFTIYSIADYLYQNGLMSNHSGHTYLYDNILSIVDPNYISKEFNFKNIIIK